MSNEEQNIDTEIEQALKEAAEKGERDQTTSSDAEAHESDQKTVSLKQLEELQEQVASYRDQALRAQAELQNVRRRAEKDVESAHKYGLEKFAQDLVPVVDNLERAVQIADRNNEHLKPFIEGIDLTRKSFFDALKKHGLESIDPHGEPFNPQYHQAMAMIEKPDAEPNTVIEVMQRGYLLNGRLVRPAMVVVSRAAPSVDMKA